SRPPARDPTMPPPRTATVLVAEPDPTFLDCAAQALTFGEARYRVIRETRGNEALRAVHAFRPDLVLAAVDLPGLSGAELVSKLRRDPEHRRRPFVGLVDKGDVGAYARMIEAGAREVIGRPFTAHEVRKR